MKELILEIYFSGVNGKWYRGVNGKQYRKSWKEFNELKNIDQNYYCLNYYDINVNSHKMQNIVKVLGK